VRRHPLSSEAARGDGEKRLSLSLEGDELGQSIVRHLERRSPPPEDSGLVRSYVGEEDPLRPRLEWGVRVGRNPLFCDADCELTAYLEW